MRENEHKIVKNSYRRVRYAVIFLIFYAKYLFLNHNNSLFLIFLFAGEFILSTECSFLRINTFSQACTHTFACTYVHRMYTHRKQQLRYVFIGFQCCHYVTLAYSCTVYYFYFVILSSIIRLWEPI